MRRTFRSSLRSTSTGVLIFLFFILKQITAVAESVRSVLFEDSVRLVCQAPLCYWRGVKYYCATVPTPELPAVLIMEYRMPIMVVGLQCQPNIRIHWRIHPAIKRKVEDSFVDGVNSGIELQFVYVMVLPMWWMGSKDYVQSTEIHLVGGLNENSPLNWSCGPNESISFQLKKKRFGTVSNTTEYYTTVFESDNQVGIWNLEFFTVCSFFISRFLWSAVFLFVSSFCQLICMVRYLSHVPIAGTSQLIVGCTSCINDWITVTYH